MTASGKKYTRILIVGIATMPVWVALWAGHVLPFQYVETWFHEAGHWLFSGFAGYFIVRPDGSGVTYSAHLFGSGVAWAGSSMGLAVYGGLLMFTRSGILNGIGMALLIHDASALGFFGGQVAFEFGDDFFTYELSAQGIANAAFPILALLAIAAYIIHWPFWILRDLRDAERGVVRKTIWQKITKKEQKQKRPLGITIDP